MQVEYFALVQPVDLSPCFTVDLFFARLLTGSLTVFSAVLYDGARVVISEVLGGTQRVEQSEVFFDNT
jgi:hypothetical protein